MITAAGFDRWGKIYVDIPGWKLWVESSWVAQIKNNVDDVLYNETGEVTLILTSGQLIKFNEDNMANFVNAYDAWYLGEFLQYGKPDGPCLISRVPSNTVMTPNGNFYIIMEVDIGCLVIDDSLFKIDYRTGEALSDKIKPNFTYPLFGEGHWMECIEYWKINEFGLLELKGRNVDKILYLEVDIGETITQDNECILSSKTKWFYIYSSSCAYAINKTDPKARKYDPNVINTFYGSFTKNPQDEYFIIYNTKITKNFASIKVLDLIESNGLNTKPAIHLL